MRDQQEKKKLTREDLGFKPGWTGLKPLGTNDNDDIAMLLMLAVAAFGARHVWVTYIKPFLITHFGSGPMGDLLKDPSKISPVDIGVIVFVLVVGMYIMSARKRISGKKNRGSSIYD